MVVVAIDGVDIFAHDLVVIDRVVSVEVVVLSG